MTKTTHFGFQKIKTTEKQARVKSVFDSVATRYDLMNDLMSFGIHRLWKYIAVNQCHLNQNDIVLDLAGGTGDLSQQFAQKVGSGGQVCLADLNFNMLYTGKKRLMDRGFIHPIRYIQLNAEQLPFADCTFDCVSIAFGLRNFTHQQQALDHILPILKPGGRLMILEFSHPTSKTVQALYDFYSFNCLPQLGKLICNDADSYQYLVESIRMHPNQETLKSMMEKAGFKNCRYQNLANGIVAIHLGTRN